MDAKKTILGTLAGTVVMFLAGWAIWGFALFNIQKNHTQEYEGLMPDMPNMLLMALSMVSAALLFTIIFDRWAGIKTFKTGAMAGAVIALLIGLNHDLMWLASANLIDGTVVLTNIVGNLVWGALAGGVIGWVLGKLSDA